MKATEQKFRVVLFTVLYIRWFQLPKPMDDTRVRHQSSESSLAVLSCGTDYSAMQGRCR